MHVSKSLLVASACVVWLSATGCGTDARDVDDDGAGGDTSSSGAGASTGSGGASTCDGLAEEPSTQTVEVVLTNGAAVDRYVMVGASGCDSFIVERMGESGYEVVPQSVGYQCGCECPAPGPPGPTALQHIAPGDSLTLTWDARELEGCVEEIDCQESYGFEGTAMVAYGFPVPAPSGEYRLTYRIYETPPDYCTSPGEDYGCVPDQTASCEADLTAEATFTLEDTGDVSIPVTVD
jgi:hypothetical protein